MSCRGVTLPRVLYTDGGSHLSDGAGGVSKVRGGQHTLVERLGYKVQGNASRLGTWTEGDKAELLSLVAELQPCGATDWEVVADKLGRWSKVRPYTDDCVCRHLGTFLWLW